MEVTKALEGTEASETAESLEETMVFEESEPLKAAEVQEVLDEPDAKQ